MSEMRITNPITFSTYYNESREELLNRAFPARVQAQAATPAPSALTPSPQLPRASDPVQHTLITAPSRTSTETGAVRQAPIPSTQAGPFLIGQNSAPRPSPSAVPIIPLEFRGPGASGSSVTLAPSLRSSVFSQARGTPTLPTEGGATQIALNSAATPSDNSVTAIRDHKVICKICLDQPASVTLIPCGHFLTCTSCLPNLINCPVCRAHIRGSVRPVFASFLE